MDVNSLQLDRPSDIHIPIILPLGRSKKCDASYRLCQKEFWLHVTFLLIACAIKTFNKFILITLLSDLTVLIRSCAACIAERIKKISQILLINSLHKPPALFNFRSISRDHPVTIEPFQFSPSETVAYEGS
jgi:hypothetical protein